MKKALILSVLAAAAVSPLANAAAVCDGGSGANVDIAPAGTPAFIKVGFTAKCSANVYSNYSENDNQVGVVAASKKGKNYFGGGSNGGGVRALGTCSTTCGTTTEITDGNADAARDAS